MTAAQWIPDDKWEIIVRNVPVPSVDLVPVCDEGVVLGRRRNDPAAGEWFVPGGRVRKGERLTDTLHRVAREELGTDVSVEESLGVYEHFYDTADVSSTDGKHYVANGFVVTPASNEFEADDQHESLRVFESRPEGLHEYTAQYLDDAGVFE